MWGKINDLEIKAPNSFNVQDEVIGGFNETINGNKRMYVKAVKKKWILGYNNMSLSDYNDIKNELDKEVASGLQISNKYSLFTVDDLNISNEKVNIMIESRNFKDKDFLEDVTITLIQL